MFTNTNPKSHLKHWQILRYLLRKAKEQNILVNIDHNEHTSCYFRNFIFNQVVNRNIQLGVENNSMFEINLAMAHELGHHYDFLSRVEPMEKTMNCFNYKFVLRKELRASNHGLRLLRHLYYRNSMKKQYKRWYATYRIS